MQSSGEKQLTASWLADELLSMVLVEGPDNYPKRNDTSGRFTAPFEGFSFETAYGVSEQGDGGFTDVNIAFGTDIADGRGNITLFGGYYDRPELYAGERAFSRDVIVEDREIGELYVGGSPMTPSGVIGFPLVNHGPGPSATTFDANGIPRAFDDRADLYNFAAVNFLQTPLQRYNAGVMAWFEINDTAEFYVLTEFLLSFYGIQNII